MLVSATTTPVVTILKVSKLCQMSLRRQNSLRWKTTVIGGRCLANRLHFILYLWHLLFCDPDPMMSPLWACFLICKIGMVVGHLWRLTWRDWWQSIQCGDQREVAGVSPHLCCELLELRVVCESYVSLELPSCWGWSKNVSDGLSFLKWKKYTFLFLFYKMAHFLWFDGLVDQHYCSFVF